MALGIVDNKFVQINKWGFPLQPGVLSLQTEQLNLSEIKDDELVVKMKYACMHPGDIVMCLGRYPAS